jgi:Ca2+-transporting ATPase
MDRPPRNPKEPLFGKRSVILALFQGISVLIIVLAVFSIARYWERGEPEARALAFTTLIFANLGLIFTNRSWSRTIFATLRTPNRALWWVSGSALVLLGLVLYIPFMRGLFHFAVLHPADLAICFGAGIFSIAWFELLKITNGRRQAG